VTDFVLKKIRTKMMSKVRGMTSFKTLMGFDEVLVFTAPFEAVASGI